MSRLIIEHDLANRSVPILRSSSRLTSEVSWRQTEVRASVDRVRRRAGIAVGAHRDGLTSTEPS